MNSKSIKSLEESCLQTICISYLQEDELISLSLFLTKILNVTTCWHFTLAFFTSAEMNNPQQ